MSWSGVACLVAAGFGLVSYCLAYPKVTRGDMVVYAGWMDFGLSLLWIPMAGCGLAIAGGVEMLKDGVGIAFVSISTIAGIVSVLWLVWGAFKYNRGAYACSLALGARMFVALLFLFAMSKLTDGKKALKDDVDNAALKAALVAVALAGFIFAKLVKPMIGTRAVR